MSGASIQDFFVKKVFCFNVLKTQTTLNRKVKKMSIHLSLPPPRKKHLLTIFKKELVVMKIPLFKKNLVVIKISLYLQKKLFMKILSGAGAEKV